MIPALIILLKILLAAVALYRIYLIYRFKKSDRNVRLKFDLTSTLEIDAGIGISLVALLAVIDETTYVMTVVLLLLGIVLNFLHMSRTIIAGDKRIMLGRYDFDLRDIKGMNASRFTLHVMVKGGMKINILIPLTDNETVRKMNYIK